MHKPFTYKLSRREFGDRFAEVVFDNRFRLYGLRCREVLALKRAMSSFKVTPQEIYDIVKAHVRKEHKA